MSLRTVLLVYLGVCVACAAKHPAGDGGATGEDGTNRRDAGLKPGMRDAGDAAAIDATAQDGCPAMPRPEQPPSWRCWQVECKWDEANSVWVGSSCGGCPIVEDPKPDLAAGACAAGAPDCWVNELGRFACKNGIYQFYIIVLP